MANERTEYRARKRRIRKKRVFFVILVPILLVIFAAIGYATLLYTKADEAISDSYKDDGRVKSALRETAVDPSEDSVSILFIGVDNSKTRDQKTSLSDALILATFNKEDKSIKMLSIPRDSYVYVPEVGYKTKITHAHAYGGPQATIETVEQFSEVPVDYYVKMNFNAFTDVVDALDGIKADVPYEFSEQDSTDTKNAIHLMPGEQTLNGEEALALARTRKLDNDIERGKRQQQIMKAVISKAASLDSVLKYGNIIEAVGDNMTTSLTFDEMKSFISYGTSGNLDIETMTLAGEDGRIDGSYYYLLDDTDLANKRIELQKHLGIYDGNL